MVLHILAIVGKLLLILLVIVAALIFCLLFTPVCYKADVKKDAEGFRADAVIYWLLHFVHAVFKYPGTDPDKKGFVEVYILGIPLLKVLRAVKDRKQKKRKKVALKSGREPYTGAKKKPTVPPGGLKTTGQEIPVEVVKRKKPNAFVRFSAKVHAFFSRLKKTLTKAENWIRFLTSDTFKDAKDVVLREGLPMLKHVLPKKISGFVAFGFEDPSVTGKILGLLGVFCGFIPEKLEIRPDFEEKKLEADVQIKGRIFLIVLLIHTVKIFMNKNFRKVLAKLLSGRKKEKAPDHKHKKKAGGQQDAGQAKAHAA